MVPLQKRQRWAVQMVKKVLERDLERHFSNVCKKLGILTLKLNVTYSRGWPDRVVVLSDGQVFWVELKTLTGIVSPLQERVHKLLRQRGHTVYVLRTKEEITNVLGSTQIPTKSS